MKETIQLAEIRESLRREKESLLKRERTVQSFLSPADEDDDFARGFRYGVQVGRELERFSLNPEEVCAVEKA